MDIVRNLDVRAAMPACPIQHEDDLLVRPSTCCFSEGAQLHRENVGAHAIGQVPERATGGGMGERHQIAPIVARLNRRDGALTGECPDSLEQRFEANAMLVGGPKLNFGAWMRGRQGAAQASKLFLKAACSSALAATCRGRGRRSRAPKRWR